MHHLLRQEGSLKNAFYERIFMCRKKRFIDQTDCHIPNNRLVPRKTLEWKEIFQHPLSSVQRKLHTSPKFLFKLLEEMRERKITGRKTQGANITGEHIKIP